MLYFFLTFFSEIYEIDISRWKEEDDNDFVETHNFKAMLKKVKQQSHVIFVGVPGSGKTATVRHIALLLQREGYDILPIKEIKCIETYCDPKNPQVFVLDDALGIFGLNRIEFDTLKKYEDRIKEPIMTNTKFLFTCREVVYRNETISTSFLSKKENLVYLQSAENALDNQDKHKLLAKYKLKIDILNPEQLAASSNMFPLICKLFSKEKMYGEYGPTLFISPVPCILKDLDRMKIENRHHYAALILMAANDNTLSEEILDNENTNTNENNFREMKCTFLKKCKVQSNTDSFQFIDALLEMERTYTKRCNNEFKFIHDSIFEIIAYHFGSQFPELILQYMSSDYIANKIKIETKKLEGKEKESKETEIRTCVDSVYNTTMMKRENVLDLFIFLQESQYPIFVKRLFRDIEYGELQNVFGNEALRHPSVIRCFIKEMQGKSYTELKSVFLTKAKVISKILEYLYTPKIDDKEEDFLKTHANKLLIEEDPTLEWFMALNENRCCARVIEWVIYFGHHNILNYIVEQILENGQINDLFQHPYTDNVRQFLVEKQQGVFTEIESDMNAGSKIEFENISDDARYFNMPSSSETPSEVEIKINSVIVAEQQWRLLCLACLSGDLNTVRILLLHINVENVQDKEHNFDPLVIACKYGYVNIVMELLKRKVDVNICSFHETPLTAASSEGHLQIVKTLLNTGANVNLNNGDKTPLSAACEGGHLNVVEELILDGADVNLNKRNKTLLKLAQGNINLEAVTKYKMMVRAHLFIHEHYKTPLTAACEMGHLSIVELLINAGANVNLNDGYKTPLTAACGNGHLNVVEELIKARSNVNLSDGDKTPLTSACGQGNLSVVKELVKHGSDVNLSDRENTPLTAACKGGHANVVEELINANADVNLSGGNFKLLTSINVWGCTNEVYNFMNYSKAGIYLRDIYKTPLIAACAGGYSCIVKTLIKAGADVNLSDGYTTPLEIASVGGHLDVVKILMKRTVDMNPKLGTESALVSALVSACYLGNYQTVVELLKAGAAVNLYSGTATPLKAACLNGHMDIILELIKVGADINLVDEIHTPLIAACEGRHNNAIFELLKRGADVNLGTKHNTPLTTACKWGSLTVVKKLLESGADANVIIGPKQMHVPNSNKDQPMIKAGGRMKHSKLIRESLKCLFGTVHINSFASKIKADTEVSLQNVNKTALTSACAGGHLNVVFELMKAGADVNLSDGNKTPLTSASVMGHLELVVELIKAGAEVNLSDGNKTPLTSASVKGHVKIVDALVKAGADANLCDGNRTPLTSASVIGHLELVVKLIKTGAKVNLSDGNKTPLISASVSGHLNIVIELIKSGADVNLEYGNRTPLTAACEGGRLNVVVELIKAGADVNQISKDGTPLIIACKYAYGDVLKKLLKSGANVNLIVGNKTSLATACNQQMNAETDVCRRDEDTTPLIIACERGHLREVKELLKFGADVNLGEKDITPLKAAYDIGHLGIVNLLMEYGANT